MLHGGVLPADRAVDDQNDDQGNEEEEPLAPLSGNFINNCIAH